VEFIMPGNRRGCEPVPETITRNITGDWIALVERGNCPFVNKVRAMQASGAVGVVVGDNRWDSLITMFASGKKKRYQTDGMVLEQYFFQMILQIS
jgi:hypothetical protein